MAGLYTTSTKAAGAAESVHEADGEGVDHDAEEHHEQEVEVATAVRKEATEVVEVVVVARLKGRRRKVAPRNDCDRPERR